MYREKEIKNIIMFKNNVYICFEGFWNIIINNLDNV